MEKIDRERVFHAGYQEKGREIERLRRVCGAVVQNQQSLRQLQLCESLKR
jgi:hypothetical protein